MKLIKALSKRSTPASLPASSPIGETETLHPDAGASPGMGFSHTTTSMPNAFGGQTTWDNGRVVAQTMPNIFGGMDRTTYAFAGGEGDGVEHLSSALEEILGGHHPNED